MPYYLLIQVDIRHIYNYWLTLIRLYVSVDSIYNIFVFHTLKALVVFNNLKTNLHIVFNQLFQIFFHILWIHRINLLNS